MDFVTLDTDGELAVATIDRPGARNAIDHHLLTELAVALDTAERTPGVRVLVVRSALEATFVAGGDIAAMRDMTVPEGRDFVRSGRELMAAFERSRLVTIAAVNGYALGGGTELALACDIRVCSTNAVFGLPEVSLGLLPGWGGTQRIARTLGTGWARRIVLTADRVDAQTALRIGLVTDVVDADALLDTVRAMARRVAANAPTAVREAKAAIVIGAELPLEYALEVEERAWLASFASPDRVEGLSAFLQRRAPTWAPASTRVPS